MDPEGTTADDLEELGTISIYFHRIKITGRSKLRSLAGLIEEEGKATTKKVTEKSLKGRTISHSTRFVETRRQSFSKNLQGWLVVSDRQSQPQIKNQEDQFIRQTLIRRRNPVHRSPSSTAQDVSFTAAR